MNYRITYPVATQIAAEVEAHFRNSRESSNIDKELLAPVPLAHDIEILLDVVFWASLRKEEGHLPTISIAFLPPEKSGQPITFAERLPFSSKVLTKLAPAVERPGIQLGVWHDGEDYYVWGATREIPGLCFVLEVIEPGKLVIKHRRTDTIGKYLNVVVLTGDEVKMVDETKAYFPGSPTILNTMLDYCTADHWQGKVNLLVQLAISMRAHGRGGIILVVPADKNDWLDSIIQPLKYSLIPPFSKLKQLTQQDKSHLNEAEWNAAFSLVIDGIAGLTAVDGATIINNKYELYAFGAKIGRSVKGSRVEQVIQTEPVFGNVPVVTNAALIGGTRHLSAAQFVHDQKDSVALVASQDKRFTIFAWSELENMVHAHRVDTLLT